MALATGLGPATVRCETFDETVGAMAAPCLALEPTPGVVLDYLTRTAKAKAAHQPAPSPSSDDLKIYNAWRQRLLTTDFAGLCRYAAANDALPPAGARRVVFFGDSITELWGLSAPELFTTDVIDRGVSGQTTTQMLDRFRADVIALHPRVVHIMAGTNDIAGNTGPTSLEWIEANIQSMTELAKAHHIDVVLGAVPPSSGFDWRPSLKPAQSIRSLNRWLARYAQAQGLIFVDYSKVLENDEGGMRKGSSDDGVHPNFAGFAVMTPLARRAVEESLDRWRP